MAAPIPRLAPVTRHALPAMSLILPIPLVLPMALMSFPSVEQERQRDFVKALRLLELRRVSGVFDDRQLAAGDALAHLRAVLGGPCAIEPPLDDQRRDPNRFEPVERPVRSVRARGLDCGSLRCAERNALEFRDLVGCRQPIEKT